MIRAFELAVNTLESNGLTMVINDVLLKVKHTILSYKLDPLSIKLNAYRTLINQDSSGVFLE